MREIKLKLFELKVGGVFIEYAWLKDSVWIYSYDNKNWKSRKMFPIAEVCQYTGIKDKNGKEIYERDILRIKNSNKPIIAVINYTLSYMGWTLSNPKNTLETAKYKNGEYVKKSALNEYVEWGYENSPRLEVIGNIYENPELI